MAAWKVHAHVSSLPVASGGKTVLQLQTLQASHTLWRAVLCWRRNKQAEGVWCGEVLGGGDSLFSTEKPVVTSIVQPALSGAG